jgi:glycosyltransferase involved in cell wall biosynthesis
MMKEGVFLSIIVPVYNSAGTLESCLRSVLEQCDPGIELIVVNDGSTDGPQRVIEHLTTEYPGSIRYTSIENAGVGLARNTGMKMASGQYLTFLDSDDHLATDYVQTIRTYVHQHHPDMLFIGYERKYAFNPGLLERIHKFGTWYVFDQVIRPEAYPDMICRVEGAPWLRVIRTALIQDNEALHFSAVRLGEDQEASLKWYLHASNVVFCEKPLYQYTVRNHSLNFSSEGILDFEKVMLSVCDHYRQKGKFEHFKSELEILFIRQMLISNMRRLRKSSIEDKYSLFMKLRTVLSEAFPSYTSNNYLRSEPLYIRVAVWLASKYPFIYKFLL